MIMIMIIKVTMIIWKLVKYNPSKTAAHCATNRCTNGQYNQITYYTKIHYKSLAKAVLYKCVFKAVLKADKM